MNFFRV